MTHDERSEVTSPNQPAQWFEITATPEQLEQLRQQHAWKINYQYINATPFIQTAADPPPPLTVMLNRLGIGFHRQPYTPRIQDPYGLYRDHDSDHADQDAPQTSQPAPSDGTPAGQD